MIKNLGLFILLLLAINLPGRSQNLTGIWRGYFITSSSDHYKFELQIKQSKAGISGVSYSYLNTVFYGKATLTGTYNNTGKKAVIKEIKTVELRMSVGSSACIMKCLFEYSKSGREEFLEGTYTSVFETDGLGHQKGEDCGGGKVYLRRVESSDFYIEPFLRKKGDGTATTTPTTKPPATTKTTPKVNPPTTAQKKPTTTKPPATRPKTTPVTTKPNNTVTAKPKADTAKRSVDAPVAKKEVPATATPNALKTRTNELVKTFEVSDENVIVKLYDNGEIDDDTISVYMDKKLVLSAKRLTASPLIIRIKMDEENSEHELVMVAENLGRIPPNTSLMIVESGDKRFDARITSTEQKNAVVRFRYVKPK